MQDPSSFCPKRRSGLYPDLIATCPVAVPSGFRQDRSDNLPVMSKTHTDPAPGQMPDTGCDNRVRPEPIELLHRVFLSLFTTGEQFRQWVSLGPDGYDLVSEFPSERVSPSQMIYAGLDVLRRRGYLTAAFFARLVTDFPRRRDEISRVVAAWNEENTPAMRTDQPPPAISEAPSATHHGGFHFGNVGNITIHAGRDVVAGDRPGRPKAK